MTFISGYAFYIFINVLNMVMMRVGNQIAAGLVFIKGWSLLNSNDASTIIELIASKHVSK